MSQLYLIVYMSIVFLVKLCSSSMLSVSVNSGKAQKVKCGSGVLLEVLQSQEQPPGSLGPSRKPGYQKPPFHLQVISRNSSNAIPNVRR